MSQILPRFNRSLLALEDARKLGRILQETGDPGHAHTVARATLPGDNRRLRGIPVVGFSVCGTAPGTDPLAAALRSVGSRRYSPKWP